MMLAALVLAALIELKPQPGVNYLGVHCGAYPGYRTQTYVTGFNEDGTIAGEVYASTRCPSPYRYGTPRTYSSWHSITWDLDGVPVETLPWDGIAPDPAFTETDADGNTIYDVLKPTSYGMLWQAILDRVDVNGYTDTPREKQTEEPQFEFAPLIEVTPNLLKGAVPVSLPMEPDRRCTSEEKAMCKSDCMDSHQSYAGCEVKTIAGHLTRVCTCIDLGLRAAR